MQQFGWFLNFLHSKQFLSRFKDVQSDKYYKQIILGLNLVLFLVLDFLDFFALALGNKEVVILVRTDSPGHF